MDIQTNPSRLLEAHICSANLRMFRARRLECFTGPVLEQVECAATFSCTLNRALVILTEGAGWLNR